MPFINSSSPLVVNKLNPIVITSRESVLSTLKTGDIIAVKVLEKIDSQNVLLNIKGAPVTVKNMINAHPGESLKVMVESNGESLMLHRLAGGGRPGSDSLKALVKFGVSRNLFSKEVIFGLDGLDNIKTIKNPPSLLTKPMTILNSLMPEVPNKDSVRKLFLLFGLKGYSPSQRLTVENGANSLYAVLRRLLETPSKKLKNMLSTTGFDQMRVLGELLGKSAALKRAVEIFRAANLLADRQSTWMSVPIPFGNEGQRNMVQLFLKREGNNEKEGGKKKDFVIYMKMKFSFLGEVRTIIRKGQGPLEIRMFTDEKAGKVLKKGIDGLSRDFENSKQKVNISMARLDQNENPELDFRNNMVSLAGFGERINVKA